MEPPTLCHNVSIRNMSSTARAEFQGPALVTGIRSWHEEEGRGAVPIQNLGPGAIQFGSIWPHAFLA